MDWAPVSNVWGVITVTLSRDAGFSVWTPMCLCGLSMHALWKRDEMDGRVTPSPPISSS